MTAGGEIIAVRALTAAVSFAAFLAGHFIKKRQTTAIARLSDAVLARALGLAEE